MKNLLIVLSIAISLCLSQASLCLSQEQTIDNQNSYLGVNFEKTPDQTEGKQKIKNERSFLFINIIINGKVKESKPQADN